jgi:histidine ammonia-lyase
MITLAHTKSLTIDETLQVVNGASVRLDPAARELLRERRAQVVQFITASQRPSYGFNRGFGHNVDLAVPREELERLQRNFMRSHACGVGPSASKDVVRATMLLRAQSLVRGHSGVRPEVVEALLAFLNKGVTPVVPQFGSVGASGDLAPLAHVGLALIGEGECFVGDEVAPIDSASALARCGLKPLALEMKEGLALGNGVQFSTACGVIAYRKLMELLKVESLATAMTGQVMLASDLPFLSDLHELRPHRGAKVVAKWIWDAMQGSPLRETHRDFLIDAEVQDPYNIRCAAQILGTCYDLLREAADTFEVEINSATDNPLILPTVEGVYTSIVSGGHFHGMPVAVKLYNLVQVGCIIGTLVNARCSRYIDGARNKGLGNDLVWPGASENEKSISSSLMIPEYVTAALANVLVGMSTPSHLFSISTNAGQEDHVSMSAGLGVRILEMIPRVAELIAIELAYATQAAAIRRHTKLIPSKHHPEAQADVDKAVGKLVKLVRNRVDIPRIRPQIEIKLGVEVTDEETRLSPVCEAVLDFLATLFPPVTEDRSLSAELQAIAEALLSGELFGKTSGFLSFEEG